MKKTRVTITVDREKLEKAKTKLGLFGGKLSTLFNAYLSEFVESMEKEPYQGRKELDRKIKEMELRIKRLEEKK
jgi:orotate phosphoribosyltransferase